MGADSLLPPCGVQEQFGSKHRYPLRYLTSLRVKNKQLSKEEIRDGVLMINGNRKKGCLG